MKKSEICYHQKYGILVRNPYTKFFIRRDEEYLSGIPLERRYFVLETAVKQSEIRLNKRDESIEQCEKCGGWFPDSEVECFKERVLCRSCLMDYGGEIDSYQLDICNQVPIGGITNDRRATLGVSIGK